jgi:hypothetical protein
VRDDADGDDGDNDDDDEGLMCRSRHLPIQFQQNIYSVAVHDDGLLVAMLPEQIDVSTKQHIKITITMHAT